MKLKTMENAADVIQRVNELDASLVWVEVRGSKVTTWRLVSNDTKRVVAMITQDDEGCYRQKERSAYRDNDNQYTELEAAKAITKFGALRGILAEDIQRRYVQ